MRSKHSRNMREDSGGGHPVGSPCSVPPPEREGGVQAVEGGHPAS